jgi:hypothetical protein
MELHVIWEALHQAFYSQNLLQEDELQHQFIKLYIHSGYLFHQAAESTDTIIIFVLGNQKYKPVGIKIHPVTSYNPDSCPLVFNPLKLGKLPPLPMNPMKLEHIKYTQWITKEQMTLVLGKIPAGFLSKTEIELLAT